MWIKRIKWVNEKKIRKKCFAPFMNLWDTKKHNNKMNFQYSRKKDSDINEALGVSWKFIFLFFFPFFNKKQNEQTKMMEEKKNWKKDLYRKEITDKEGMTAEKFSSFLPKWRKKHEYSFLLENMLVPPGALCLTGIYKINFISLRMRNSYSSSFSLRCENFDRLVSDYCWGFYILDVC